MIKTTHRYLDKYPIRPDTEKLIIGTIHPHKEDNFIMDYFYGNMMSLWSILSDAFPHHDFSSAESIQQLMIDSCTSISDMIYSCYRDHDKITQDRDLYNLKLNTHRLNTGIVNSNIDTIFFTSGFAKNSAARLFIDAFKIKYSDSWDEVNRTFIISEQYFGREIVAHVLYSPSGQANIGISRSKAYTRLKDRYISYSAPVKQFRIDYYKKKFNYLK